jgi:hypothetical protein
MSCTRTEDIRDTPNSTVSPARNSSTATLLSVSSDDAPAGGGVSVAEEEEDGIATYRRRRRAVCFTRARSPTSKSKEGRRAAGGFEKDIRVFAERGKIRFKTRRPRPLLCTGRGASGNPQSNSTTSINGHVKNPPRNHFERGQRLHHLATSSAPDDLVELVPRRANVGAKAKTPPFARCLRQPRCTNGDKATGRFAVRPMRRRTKTCDEVVASCGLVQHRGPRVIRPIVIGPEWPLRITDLICKGLPVITVCNPALWEYSRDNLGA